MAAAYENIIERTEWFHQKKWGVFLHLLYGTTNNPEHAMNMGVGKTDWTECVNAFDVDLFAKQLADTNAGYLMLTLTQGTQYFIAPNETFERIAGYKQGETCSKIDFVLKMSDALRRYDIDLFLYFHGDGPIHDPVALKAFGPPCNDPFVPMTYEFLEKWAGVIREYSERYGDRIKGWWIDGCYEFLGYNNDNLKVLARAARAGNPDALVASNYYGCTDKYSVLLDAVRGGIGDDDYTAGELVHFNAKPYGPTVGRTRWHILSFLGVTPKGEYEYSGWAKPGSKYTPAYMHDYVKDVYERGGVVTIDICAYRDGHIDPVQAEVLRALKDL